MPNGCAKFVAIALSCWMCAHTTSAQARQHEDPLFPAQLQSQFQKVADEVAPSVVAISASLDVVDADCALRSSELTGDKLDGLLERVTRSVGTGFVIDADGFIVTNEHVVGQSDQLWVTTDQGVVYPAIVVGSDPRSDLAVLKIPASGLKPARIAAPGKIERGQWAITLGNPYGLASAGRLAMSVGIISA
ncbi:MAG: S1C family serine protease, partial [Tepidisphaeraceae bacterium]